MHSLTLAFATPEEFRSWLDENQESATEIWLRIYKKRSGVQSISYAEALDEALCFGWIDAQKKPESEQAWLQRFCPRKPRSTWSKVNCDHANRLLKQGKMTARGVQEIDKAKADGRWDAAYDSPKNAVPPEEFLVELQKRPVALAFYESLNRANQYAIAYRLQTAEKPETREKRMRDILAMLERGEKFH